MSFNIKIIGTFVLLLVLVTCPKKFCSVRCATKDCNGNLQNQCNNKCMNNWVANGNTCDPNSNTYFFLHNTSPDLGGSLIVYDTYVNTTTGALMGYVQTTSKFCNNLDVSLYGPYYNASKIRVMDTVGVSPSFYALTVYFGILTVDSSSPSSGYWQRYTYFTLDFIDSTGLIQSNQFQLYGSTQIQKEKYCYRDKRSQNWNRMEQSYTYSTQNAALAFDLYNNQTNSTAMWGLRQFIIVYRTCHWACTICFGGTVSQCTVCLVNATYTMWISGTTCNQSCLTGYGHMSVPNICILCDPLCTSCYEVSTNCSACTRTGNYTSYLFASNFTCLVNCPVGYYANKFNQTCDLCDTNCQECLFSPTYCTVCHPDYGYYNHVCYFPCPLGYYNDTSTGTSNCTLCSAFCINCVGPMDLCTQCQTTSPYTSFLYNTTNLTGSCQRVCPQGTYHETYNGTGPNLCLACDPSCTDCTGNPSPCSACAASFYFYGTTCVATCPTDHFASNISGTGVCYLCATFCVQLTIQMYHPTVLNEQLYIDISFSQPLNYATFNITDFQTVTIDQNSYGYTLDMFTLTYQVISNSLYRILIEPKGYIFLYNATFRVKTRASGNITDFSSLGYPFAPQAYQASSYIDWFVIKGPEYTQLQKNIMTSFSTLSTKTNDFLASSYVQQFKKSGVFSLLFSGAQVTSLTVLSNHIMSQNMYEGVRFFAIFVHYDVPPYQKISNQTKRFIQPTVQDQIRNAMEVDRRTLFSTDTMYWRFQRTGQTSFFIYDCYIPIFLIVTCWIFLIIAYKCKDRHWYPRHASKIFTVTHKVHEITLLYILMASIVQFIYFQATSTTRIVSAIICVFFNIYYVIYQLYIYYDMMKYPMAEIGNKLYDYYVIRYGVFLKNIRYVQYNINQEWSVTHWFRPYNFHFLSYYKKFLMIIVLPLFYDLQYAQMGLLLFIQLFQMARVWKVWPFVSKRRNWLRFSLEFALALFFLVNIIQIKLLNEIQQGDINQMDGTIRFFHALGWTGFISVFYFNMTFVIIVIYDLCVGLKASNRSKMDYARKKYYFQKIKDYQQDNQQANKQLVNRWIRLGNINGTYYGELPQINVRIQEYRMRLTLGKFDVQVKKISKLRMMKPRSHRKKNNTVTQKKIEKKGVIEKHTFPELYNILHNVFKQYTSNHIETVVLKTFINVFQQDFEAGEDVPLDRSNMFQKLQLISFDNQRQQKELEFMSQGFPIDNALFARF